VREQVADAVDLVIHQARGADGSRKVVAVGEVVRVAGGPATREIYRLQDGEPDGEPRRPWRAALSEELAARLAAGRAATWNGR
jgi:pilus assembly protein CpaF